MKKKTSNFLVASVTAIIFFIISLIIQYYISTVSVLIAILCGITAVLITICIININSNEEKFSLDIFIFKIIVAYVGIVYIILLSTIGNMICEGICAICLIIGIILFIIDGFYLSIKEVIKEYKKYNETQ